MSELRPDVERFRAVEAIFDRAVGLQGAERAEYLHRACGADAELRSQVENLLRTDAETGESFLLSPREQRTEAEVIPGGRIAGYEILGELGRGGMGIVYRARQPRIDRVVALKVILGGQMAAPEEVLRFERETRAAASLDHPNIVPIHEVGEAGGIHFYSMRLLDGGTLARPIAMLERDPRAAARLVEKISLAIHFAHEHGILHRDLKPANILLDALGEPHVSDFGLARTLDADVSLTLTGQVMGTASYMAPEQVSGQKGSVSRAADVYSLGAILYELLAHRPPFQGDTAFTTLQRVLREEPQRPSSFDRTVPADLERICLKCLEKDPRRRYATAAALAADLRRFLNGEPVTARRIGPPARTWRWCRRNPAAVAILLLLLVTVAVSSISGVLWRSQRDAALESLRTSYREQARAGRWGRLAGQRVQGLELLARAARLKAAPDLRNEAVACMGCCDLVLEKSWEGAPAGTQAVAFDAALEVYARAPESGPVSVRRVADDSEIGTLDVEGAAVTSLLFSPDGARLAARARSYERPGDLIVWDWRRGTRLLFLAEAVHGDAFDFGPSGDRIVVARSDGSIRQLDLEAAAGVEGSGRQRNANDSVILPPGGIAADALSFSPDGRRLLVASRGSNKLRIVDVESPATSRGVELAAGVSALAWHPGGQYFAAACEDFGVYLARVDGDRSAPALRGHGSRVIAVAFSRAGDLLASVSWDGTLRLWHPFSGEELVRASSPLTGSRGLRFSRDDRALGYCRFGSSLRIYRPIASDEHYSLRSSPESRYPNLGFSPDGRLLATSGSSGVKLWGVATRSELADLECGSVYWLAFQPGTGSLITSSVVGHGLQVWPIVEDPGAPGHLRVGPPRRIASEIVYPRRISVSADGRYLAVLKGTSDVVVLDLEKSATPSLILSHPGVVHADISSGGRWLATASDSDPEVWIWEGIHGTRVARLEGRKKELSDVSVQPTMPSASIAFSPDGRSLAINTTEECCLWDTETWKRRWSFATLVPAAIPGSIAFSNSGRLIAIPDASGTVRLLESGSGAELAQLDSSAVQPAGGFQFGRADSLLAGTRLNRVDFWDLGRIRARLREMGLDWTDDPLPPRVEPDPPIAIELDRGEPGGDSK